MIHTLFFYWIKNLFLKIVQDPNKSVLLLVLTPQTTLYTKCFISLSLLQSFETHASKSRTLSDLY